MRRPLHDTPPGYLLQAPAQALAADEALLDQVRPGGPPAERWYVVDRPAVVLGLALHRRAAEVLDLERCARAGVEVLERRAGGGAVLLDAHLLCYAVALPLPHALVTDDLTASYRWLGEQVCQRLQGLGVAARRVEVEEARADVARLRAGGEPALLATCYGGLSPHEVVVGHGKIVGLAQVRRRQAALFQAGVLLRDQSGLADLLRLPHPDDSQREALRARLHERSVGLMDLLGERLPPLADLVRALSPGPAAS